jgi:hypothetical protein
LQHCPDINRVDGGRGEWRGKEQERIIEVPAGAAEAGASPYAVSVAIVGTATALGKLNGDQKNTRTGTKPASSRGETND